VEPSDISQLFEYVADSRRRFLTAFRQLGWREVTRNREATHNSMHGIFIHMLEVEESYLHYDLPGIPWPHGERDPVVFDTFEKMEAYDQAVATKAREFFAGLTADGLGREVLIPDWGETTSIEHVLLHTFLDEMAHVGELVCLMWQIDVEPPFRSIVRRWRNPRYTARYTAR